MFGSFSQPPTHTAFVDQVSAWTRQRFSLAPDSPVLVSELACASPGCPPLETVVAFWTHDAAEPPLRHHFKVFKPVAAVQWDDLPFAWMKRALVLPDGQGCDCC